MLIPLFKPNAKDVSVVALSIPISRMKRTNQTYPLFRILVLVFLLNLSTRFLFIKDIENAQALLLIIPKFSDCMYGSEKKNPWLYGFNICLRFQ